MVRGVREEQGRWGEEYGGHVGEQERRRRVPAVFGRVVVRAVPWRTTLLLRDYLQASARILPMRISYKITN